MLVPFSGSSSQRLGLRATFRTSLRKEFPILFYFVRSEFILFVERRKLNERAIETHGDLNALGDSDFISYAYRMKHQVQSRYAERLSTLSALVEQVYQGMYLLHLQHFCIQPYIWVHMLVL